MARDLSTRSASRTRAAELRAKAAALFERFNEAFWDEEFGFYAFCLDGEKKPVLSVASNPGHLPVVGHRAAGAGRSGWWSG